MLSLVTAGIDLETLDMFMMLLDIGLKYDINELGAAYAIAQLKKTDRFIRRRLEIAKMYNKELKNCPHISIPIKKSDHIYNEYIIKVDKNRDSFAKELSIKGIFTSLHFIPLHLLSYYKQKYNLRVNDFPSALTNYQQILSLPIYAELSNEEALYVCKQIKDIAKTRVYISKTLYFGLKIISSARSQNFNCY